MEKRIKEISSFSSNKYNEEVLLVAVTKTVEASTIIEATDYGIKVIGENKVQELLAKWDEIKDKVIIHFIGHLQRNKVKYIVDKVEMIQSVDSLKLAQEISRQCISINKKMKILLQVNIANEDTKYGFSLEEVKEAIESISLLDNLIVSGFMTIVPYARDPENVRIYFRRMRKLFDDYSSKYSGFEYLSMGMSNDFLVAIEEGANIIRVGSSIFGER